MGKITLKPVQIHFECVCGFNLVDTDNLQIKWSELSASGIVRKKDIKTGKSFLLLKQFSKECTGHEE
jgi:hypothetical protein